VYFKELWGIQSMTAQPIKPKLWTPIMLADHLGVSKKWIYHRTQNKGPEHIPHLKMGKLLRFDPDSDAFKRWLLTHRKH
jgi:hypothetical protein